MSKKKSTPKPTPAERGHHRRSPSSLQYREACPAFENRDNGDSEASLAGTRQHEAFEKRDLSLCEDREEEVAVENCLHYVDALTVNYPKGSTIIQEAYLKVDDDETTAGYPDWCIISPCQTEAEVVDLKFGRWEVEPAETNLQGIAYGLGLRYKFPNLKKFTVHFLMPYLNFIDRHTFESKDFPALYARVRAVVARTDVKKPEERPNFGTCIFCAKLGVCKSAADFFIRVGRKFAPLEIPKSVDTTLLMEDPEQAGLAMRIASLAGSWAAEFKRRMALKALEDDNFIPDDYQLISYPERKIEDQKTLIEMAERAGVTKKDIETIKKVGLTDIEKLISALYPKGQKKAGLELFKKAIKEIGAVVDGSQVTYLGMKKSKAE